MAIAARWPAADRGVPRRDREGEEAPARLRNGDPELGDLVARRHACAPPDRPRRCPPAPRRSPSPSAPPSAAIDRTRRVPTPHRRCETRRRWTPQTASATVADGITIDRHRHGRRTRAQRGLPARRRRSRASSRPDPAPTARRCATRSTASGSAPSDLAHIVVTHIHIDHAGGAGALLDVASRAPRCGSTSAARRTSSTRRGSSRAPRGPTARSGCDASTATTLPCPRGADPRGHRRRRDRARRPAARRSSHAPGHASHHVALLDERDRRDVHGRGDRHVPAVGHCLPSRAPAARGRRRGRRSRDDRADRASRARPSLLTSHFGPSPTSPRRSIAAAEASERWSETVGDTLATRIRAPRRAMRSTARSGELAADRVRGRRRPAARSRRALRRRSGRSG